MLGYVLYHPIKLKRIFLTIIIVSICYYLIQGIIYYNLETDLPILIWWSGMMAVSNRIINCGQYSCLITNERNFQNKTELAYLFYASEFSAADLPLPKDRLWAVVHEESPRNEAIFLDNQTWDIFDITSTFSRDSDFPITLQYLNNLNLILDQKYFVSTDRKNQLLNKLAPVLYIQSNCETLVERDKIVKELMKYVPIDSFGACLHNKDFPKEVADIYTLDYYNEELFKMVGKYKFTISIENAICDDYITEKLWRPLIVGSVPIYLGAPTIKDWLPNKKSAILINDFQNIQLLGEYINRLNQNDQFYEEYLEHKLLNRIENSMLISVMAQGPFGLNTEHNHPFQAFECHVCSALHEIPPSVVHKKRTKSVYNCPPPPAGNSWALHWKLGKCLGQHFTETVRNGSKFNKEICIQAIWNN